jgi:hypothetical protein
VAARVCSRSAAGLSLVRELQAPASTRATHHTSAPVRPRSGWATVRSSSPAGQQPQDHGRPLRVRERSTAQSGQEMEADPQHHQPCPAEELHVGVDLRRCEPPGADGQAQRWRGEEHPSRAKPGGERQRHRGPDEGHPDAVVLARHGISLVRHGPGS